MILITPYRFLRHLVYNDMHHSTIRETNLQDPNFKSYFSKRNYDVSCETLLTVNSHLLTDLLSH